MSNKNIDTDKSKNPTDKTTDTMNAADNILVTSKNDVSEQELSQTEQTYQKLYALMKSLRCMTVCQETVDMHQKVAKQFLALSGYKDSEECAKTCKRSAKKMKEQIKQIIYERAQQDKNEAKLPKDYESAANEFQEISGYLDADDMTLQCKQMSVNLEKKSMIKRLTISSLIILFVIAVLIGSTTSHAKYYLANVYSITGSYNPAIKMYKKLGKYKDCEERIVKNEYLNGVKLMKEDEYKNAAKAFRAAGNYKDSEKRKVEMEKQLVKNSKIGDIVKIGNCKWIILNKQSNGALLLKKTPISGIAYQDDLEDVTWETSTLREWLGTKYLLKTFSESELNNIYFAINKNDSNIIYDIDGGNETKDKIFILSKEEAVQYHDLLKKAKNNSWLRTPGSSKQSAAFVSVKGVVMDYGYINTSKDIAVRPAFWLNVE